MTGARRCGSHRVTTATRADEASGSDVAVVAIGPATAAPSGCPVSGRLDLEPQAQIIVPSTSQTVRIMSGFGPDLG
jgi:hypothetical protein